MAKDVLAAVRTILAGKTSAGQAVGVELAQATQRPAIRYRLDGLGRSSADLRVKTRRVVFDCYGRPGPQGHTEANRLQLEVEEVLIPPAGSLVHGYKGTAGDLYVSNVEHDFGPSWAPDPDTGEARYIVGYMFTFY